MCTLGTAKVLDQGDGDDEFTDFWAYLGSGDIASAEEPDEPITEFKPLLFRVDGNPEAKLKEVAKGCFKQRPGKLVRVLDKGSLNEDDVFLMDSGWELFVWIGSAADTSEKIAAMGAADR